MNLCISEGPAAKGSRPQFSSKPVIKQVEKNLVIECAVKAEPPPDVQWLFSGKPLEADERHKLSRTGTAPNFQLVLEILAVAGDDAGEYKVVVKNPMGESNATINLNFNQLSTSQNAGYADSALC